MDTAIAYHTQQITALLDEAYATRINDLKRSMRLAKSALHLSREMDDKALMAKSLSLISLFSMIMGAFKSSISQAREAIAYYTELNDEKGVADASYNIAGVYYKTNNYHLGLIHLINCLQTYRKLNDHHNQARVQKSLGTIYEFINDQKNAIKAYRAAIDAAQKVNDVNMVSNVYNPLSGIYIKLGKIGKAEQMIEKAIALKKKTLDIRGLAFALYGRGKVYIHTGRYNEAEDDFNAAIDIHIKANETLGLGMAYNKMGLLYMHMERYDQASEVLHHSLEHAIKYNLAFIKFKSYHLLYQISKLKGDTVNSLKYLELYLVEKEAVINTQTLKTIENYELIKKMETMETETRMQLERAEILEKKERAEHSARVKQEFLSTMSHEIRTPLNAVTSITSLLKDRSDEEDKKLLDSLKFASNNLMLIINDILDFTKLDAGKVKLDMRPGKLIDLLENLTKTYDSMAREKGLQLELQISKGISDIYEFDETKLSQILGNLISNGIKYTDVGRVDFEVSLLKSEGQCDIIQFKITDTGIGIPESYLSEIFSRFSQPRSVTTRKQGGSGLGLAIVKKLIELHSSEIHFESEVGKGSEFYFDLKLKRSGEVVKTPENIPTTLKNKTVLLAEDNMINALVARKLLSNWGITSVHAVNGLEAIEKSKQQVYDFILMDIHMPEMNGFDATMNIRSVDNPNTHTPIFALTADITAEHQDEYSSYFNGFLRKPIEINKLFEALSS